MTTFTMRFQQSYYCLIQYNAFVPNNILLTQEFVLKPYDIFLVVPYLVIHNIGNLCKSLNFCQNKLKILPSLKVAKDLNN